MGDSLPDIPENVESRIRSWAEACNEQLEKAVGRVQEYS